MTTIQEHYIEIVKQGQEAVLTAVDAWTKAVQDAIGQVPAVTLPIHPNQAIDQAFDLAGTLLGAQRDLAKDLLHASAAVAQTFRTDDAAANATQN